MCRALLSSWLTVFASWDVQLLPWVQIGPQCITSTKHVATGLGLERYCHIRAHHQGSVDIFTKRYVNLLSILLYSCESWTVSKQFWSDWKAFTITL
jgi:hypothetical protein